ncbi:hypothetical protein QTO34_003639 [Cnephaeus nilssonii]|uniref:Uncharacterized protein n=1 Tax=Cnephaeus nilssonii TaxID=3371016 RepID=A0AA40HRV4_CNENI|nr:hypothetical protein QTO34_003639 [Eptesicus nilssonii]
MTLLHFFFSSMNPMTSAGPQANTVFVEAPHNGRPVIPGNMSQVPRYPLNQPQVHIISGNPPGLEPPVYMQLNQGSFKEGKVLGAIQIVIGLIHIGLGSIMGTIIAGNYLAISFIGGNPFWAGIWVVGALCSFRQRLKPGSSGSSGGGTQFIISGSLSVASEQQPGSSCLLNGSLGLNIISAICSMVGIMLFITELIINPHHYYYPDYYFHWGIGPGLATSAVLLIFSLLEFCIACTCAHFGCQLLRQSQNSGPMVFQPIYTNPGPVNSPPYHVNVVQGSQ